jgi:hypothetical protein
MMDSGSAGREPDRHLPGHRLPADEVTPGAFVQSPDNGRALQVAAAPIVRGGRVLIQVKDAWGEPCETLNLPFGTQVNVLTAQDRERLAEEEFGIRPAFG